MWFMINIKHVYKEFKLDEGVVYTALSDVSVTIKAGEFVSLIGPSGSGKSTLMHIIGLLDKPTRGEVFIEDKDVPHFNDNQLSKLRSEFVGFVFQQFNLISKLNVLENIILPTIYTTKKLDYDPKEKAMYLLERFGIADKAKSHPNKISGGQQQRVAIARALIMEPKLILADEPTGNLDTKTGEEIMKLLKELNQKEKITVLIVTHEANVAARAKRQIKIVDGKIV